jgi:steroid 5-alpha reductase family enzyme
MQSLFQEYMLPAGVTIAVYMTLWFAAAQLLKDNGIVDVAWGLGFCTVSVLLFLKSGATLFSPSGFLTGLILVWGIRLSAHIGYRNKGRPEDFRYQNFRKKWGRHQTLGAFLQVFVLQGFIMWWVLMPVYVAASAPPVFPEGWKFIFEIVGLILFAVGFLFEALGDYQLWVFKRKPENAGKIMTTGLWKYTRHPNYFGEAVVWWGIALFVFPFPYGWLGLTAPILMTWLLTRVSGVPMLEEKYAGRADFQEYARKTPAFFPRLFPPK